MVAVRMIFDLMTFLIYWIAYHAECTKAEDESVYSLKGDDNTQETMQYSTLRNSTLTQLKRLCWVWYQIFIAFVALPINLYNETGN